MLRSLENFQVIQCRPANARSSFKSEFCLTIRYKNILKFTATNVKWLKVYRSKTKGISRSVHLYFMSRICRMKVIKSCSFSKRRDQIKGWSMLLCDFTTMKKQWDCSGISSLFVWCADRRMLKQTAYKSLVWQIFVAKFVKWKYNHSLKYKKRHDTLQNISTYKAAVVQAKERQETKSAV